MSTELVPIAALERMAQAMTQSKLFGITSPDQALSLMLVAQAEGLHPATAARDYHIIQGRPALKADAMMARYLASGGRIEWHDHSDQKVSATFTHPQGGSLRIEWDMERAKQAGLGGKEMWHKYPRQMLRARVISEGIRATNPGIAIGIYTPEEVQDMEPIKDVGSGTAVPQRKRTKAAPEDFAAATETLTQAPVLLSADQVDELDKIATDSGIGVDALLKRAEVATLGEIQAADFDGALKWLRREAAKRQSAAEEAQA